MKKNESQELMGQSDPHPGPPHKGEGEKEFARNLRNNAAPAERILWQKLKLLKSEGRHFRRQVVLAGYVADFACHYPKVIIELDGGQHSDAVTYDEERTKKLASHGYRVLRFWNAAVYESLEGVVDRIRYEVGLPTAFTYDHLKDSNPPPSPLWGGPGWGSGNVPE